MKEQPKKGQFFYHCCKFLTTLILTVIILVPIVFIVGTDQTFYSHKHIYRMLSQSPSLKTVHEQVGKHLDQLGTTFDMINLYSAQNNDTKRSSYLQKDEVARWQSLKEVGHMLGYFMYEKGVPMVSRTIIYPTQNITSHANNKEFYRPVFKKAYQFNKTDNSVIYLKRKMTKYIRNYIKRMKWTKTSSFDKQYNFLAKFKNFVIDMVEKQEKQKIWLFVLNQQNQEFHHALTFSRKMQQWQGQNKNQKIIVVSRRPIDKDHIRIAQVQVNTSRQLLLDQIKNLDSSLDNYELPFEVNKPADVLGYLVKKHQGSLLRLSKFIENCHDNYNCHSTIANMRKWIENQNKQKICSKGENFINNMKDQQFSQFMMDNLKPRFVNDVKKYKKDCNFYFNVIKVDVCGLDASHAIQEEPEKKEDQGVERKSKDEKKKQKKEKKEKKEAKEIKNHKNDKKEKQQKEQKQQAKQIHHKNVKKRIEELQKQQKSGKSQKEKKSQEKLTKEEKQKKQKNIKDKLQKANKELEERQKQKEQDVSEMKQQEDKQQKIEKTEKEVKEEVKSVDIVQNTENQLQQKDPQIQVREQQHEETFKEQNKVGEVAQDIQNEQNNQQQIKTNEVPVENDDKKQQNIVAPEQEKEQQIPEPQKEIKKSLDEVLKEANEQQPIEQHQNIEAPKTIQEQQVNEDPSDTKKETNTQ